MKTIYKNFLVYIFSIFLSMGISSCVDDFNPDFGVVDGSEQDIAVTINFEPLSVYGIESRAGSENGLLIQDIKTFRMLVYDESGEKLLYNYLIWDNGSVNETTDVYQQNYNKYEYNAEEASDNTSAKLTYRLRIPSGKYYIYGVANAEKNITPDKYATRNLLKSISCEWNKDDISENSQMFGVFSIEDNQLAYKSDKPVIITDKSSSINCWLRRLASKVTVAFDGTGLFDNVQVYIESIHLRDIPKNCMLGIPNVPGIDPEFGDTYDYDNLYVVDKQPKMQAPDRRYDDIKGVIFDGATDEIQQINHAIPLIPDDYLHICNKRHPYLGMGSDSENSNDETIVSNAHAHVSKAFFFYENMQGKSIAGRSKYQDANDDKKIDNPDPEENNLDSGWKDGKAYGTYVEVKGFYRCTDSDGHVSDGPITYRFMLGKDAESDFNAERNHHYQLTLKFKGYGNDADWHIVYENKRGIEIQSPMYISYLFNKKMMASIRVSGVLPTGSKLRAKIVDCDWKPWGIADSESFPLPTKGFYSPVTWTEKDGPWNSFLSLRRTQVVKVEIPGKENMPSNQYNFTESWEYNKKYYTDNECGERDYDIVPKTDGYDSNDDKGLYFVSKLAEDGVGNVTERLFTIPLYTRAKELITRIGFTGNNPYTEYPRSGTIEFSIVDASGKAISGFEPVQLQVIQVRRIVNPKGVWRKSGSTQPFRVTLMRLINESSDFKEFDSQGKWYAEVVPESDAGVISLSSTEAGSGMNNRPQTYVSRIEGEAEHPIDFYINFHGKNGCAIVRVRYHNYTCEHDIFCREGYEEPIDVTGDGKNWWPAYNVDHFQGKKAIYTKSPLQQGSFFRRENYTAILASNDKKYGFNVQPNGGNFDVIGSDEEVTTLPWNKIVPSASSSTPSNWTIENSNERIPTGDDFYSFIAPTANDLNFKISKAYGVLYGDGAEKTQTKPANAYGYDRTDGEDDERGMRGVFVYNNKNTAQIFFPIGATGYGHRQGPKASHESGVDGTLRYAGREALMPENASLKERPLFYDLYKRPGAIYWMRHYYKSVPNVPDKNYIDCSKSSAFDMNYFTMGFEGYGENDAVPNGVSTSHGCFIRTVIYRNPNATR